MRLNPIPAIKSRHTITLEAIENAITDGESQTLELKKSLSQIKPAFETLCAFLNTDGGIVIIGSNQQGKLIGQEITDNTKQEIAKEIAKIEPLPDSITIQYVPLNKKNGQLVILSTPKGALIPYTYNGRPFYRNQSSTMRMPQTRYSQLLLERGAQEKNSWEMQTVNADIDDLDHEEIKRTIRIAVDSNRLDTESLNESVEEVLSKLELIQEGKLTNAAMVLFSKSVTPDFSQCLIKMARFRGLTETSEFIDNQMIYGNAFQIMKSANEFIMKHIPVASFFDESKLERVDKPLLPVLSVREALSNSICHRDYSIHNGAITLAIFDDRMEIWNNGTLPSYLTLDDLKKRHKSYPRNKKIAKIFYFRRYVETWGTGTTKMIELCRKNNLPDPVFEEYSSGLSVTFRFKEAIKGTIKSNEAEKNLNARQKAILSIIKKNKKLSFHSIKGHLDKPPTDRMIRKDLNLLKKLGLIHLEGYGRSALWITSE